MKSSSTISTYGAALILCGKFGHQIQVWMYSSSKDQCYPMLPVLAKLKETPCEDVCWPENTENVGEKTNKKTMREKMARKEKKQTKCGERKKKKKRREGSVQLCYQNLSRKCFVFASNTRSSGSSHTGKWFTLYQQKAESMM